MSPYTQTKLLCWVLVLVISIAVCMHSILDKWRKWETSPVIISFADTMSPIWQFTFPAVTVCSLTKSRASVFNYTRAFNAFMKNSSMTEDDQRKFEALHLLCGVRGHPAPGVEDNIDPSAVDIMRSVSPPISEMLSYFRWRDKEYNLTAGREQFGPLLTERGICYSFNMMNSRELYSSETVHIDNFPSPLRPVKGWSLDGGFDRNSGLNTYPYRALGAGNINGLTLILDSWIKDLDYVCSGPHQGFKVYMHNPAEIPTRDSKSFFIPLNQHGIIRVKPSLMTTSDDLKDYTPERRQCHYSSRRLRFFSVYTQNNCKLECLTNYTLHMCDCVSFHMPRDANTSICSPKRKPRYRSCVEYAEDELPKGEMAALLQELSDSPDTSSATIDGFRIKECDCLPACTDLQYEVQGTLNSFPWKEVLEGASDNSTYTGLTRSRASIFFDDVEFFTRRRSELYGQTDFLASCGGLLGLFMGFSILSLVEIVYFLTIRACCNIHKERDNKKKNTVFPTPNDDLAKQGDTDNKQQLA